MPLGFLGEYEYRIDDKGRVPLPPKYRDRFKDGGVLAQGLEKCIQIYPLPEWEKVVEELGTIHSYRYKSRRLVRFTFGSAFDFELDRQGRVALPPPLRQYADLKESAIVVGANKYLELWDRENWNQEKALSTREAWQISESIENH
jgi:MraZ protein